MTSQPTISTSRLLLRVVILFALWRGALFAFDFAGMAMTVERTVFQRVAEAKPAPAPVVSKDPAPAAKPSKDPAPAKPAPKK